MINFPLRFGGLKTKMLRQHPFDRCPFDKGHYSIPTQAMHYYNGNPLNHYQPIFTSRFILHPLPPQKKEMLISSQTYPLRWCIKVDFSQHKNRGFPTKKEPPPDFPDCETPGKKFVQNPKALRSWILEHDPTPPPVEPGRNSDAEGNGWGMAVGFGMRGGKKQRLGGW